MYSWKDWGGVLLSFFLLVVTSLAIILLLLLRNGRSLHGGALADGNRSLINTSGGGSRGVKGGKPPDILAPEPQAFGKWRCHPLEPWLSLGLELGNKLKM